MTFLCLICPHIRPLHLGLSGQACHMISSPTPSDVFLIESYGVPFASKELSTHHRNTHGHMREMSDGKRERKRESKKEIRKPIKELQKMKRSRY